jgi:hypothetical protein
MLAWLAHRLTRRSTPTSTPPSPRCRLTLDSLEDRTTPTVSTITGNFNGIAIRAGDDLWFSSRAAVSGVPASGATLEVTNQTISFTAGGTSYNLAVPDTTVTLSPGQVDATVTNDANGWEVTSSLTAATGGVFLSGLEVPLPQGLPAKVQNVTWSGDFTASVTGLSVNWQWEAAAYRHLAGTDAGLNVKPTDARTAAYHNADRAGTPEADKQFLVGGGTGRGGVNWTGHAAGRAVVSPDVPQVQGQASLSGVVDFTDGNTTTLQSGVQVMLTGTNSQNQSVSMTFTTGGDGSYSFTGLLPGTYTISIVPPAAPAGDLYNSTQFTTGQVDGAGGGTTTTGTTSPSITLGATDVGTQFDFLNNYAPLG